MIRSLIPARAKGIDPEGRRLIGLNIDTDEPILGVPGHSSIYGANGSGKSTRVAMPALLSMISAEPAKGLMVLDGKDGEIAAQAAELLAELGFKVAVIDDLNTRPELAHLRINVNPMGSILSAWHRDPRDVMFAIDILLQALVPDPERDERNQYFRDWPKKVIEFAIWVLLNRAPELVTPGGIATILSDQDMLTSMAKIEAEEGDVVIRGLAQAILGMQGHEHWPQHLERAQKALRLFGPQTRLAEVGKDADVTHEQLIREGWIVFLVGPQRFMTALGPYFALHLLSLCDALYQNIGEQRVVADEWTNCPVKPLVSALTTLRAYGGELTMISQSPSEVIRKFGEREAQTIEDNSITKQWLGFSNFKEAEKISRAMGEEHAVASSLSGESGGLKTNTNLSLIKQRRMSAAELMAMPRDQQLVHVKGVGFFVCRTIAQNQIAPYCDLLAPNPLEGGKLPSDPKITLVTP